MSAHGEGRGRRHLLLSVALGCLAVVGACVSKPLTPADPGPYKWPRTPTTRPADTAQPPTAEPLPTDLAPLDADASSAVPIRVALASSPSSLALVASGAWRLESSSRGTLVRATAGEGWSLERSGPRLRATRPDGFSTPWVSGALELNAEGAGVVRFGTKRYRGALRFTATDSGILVVNRLPLEEYLRGVVPLEIGGRVPSEQAAVEAQAIAARSYTAARLLAVRAGGGRSADFDLLSSVSDQVYGGLDAERPFSDAAIRSTSGLVVLFNGRVANAPFHSACGGETAAAEEVWRTRGEPHLQRVSDRIPGTSRYYCDGAPRFSWTRTLTGGELDGALRRYLASVATGVPSTGPGSVRAVSVQRRTPSGRVGDLEIETDRGRWTVRANDTRTILRTPGGESLNSTYFSVTMEQASAGGLARLIIRGNGYGHGIGMCQWGAIGRARAGQDVRTILRSYYPGTTIGPLPASIRLN